MGQKLVENAKIKNIGLLYDYFRGLFNVRFKTTVDHVLRIGVSFCKRGDFSLCFLSLSRSLMRYVCYIHDDLA